MHTIKLGNITSKIEPCLPEDINNALSLSLAYKIEGAFFSDKCKYIWCPYCRKKTILNANNAYECERHGIVIPIQLWDGQIRLYHKRWQTFGTGLYSKIIPILDHYSLEYKLLDNRVKPEKGNIYNFPLTLRDYQQETLNKMNSVSRGIIKSATGSGKTVVIGAYLAQLNVPTLIIVPRKTLLSQFHKNLSDWLGTEIGWIGEGICNPKRITIATMQSLNNAYPPDDKEARIKFAESLANNPEREHTYEVIKKVVESVSCLIIDECQHTQAITFQFLNLKATNAYYRFGFSATPFFSKELSMSVERVTGRVIIDINASKLIKSGYLSKPTIILKKFDHKQAISKIKARYKAIYDSEVIYNEERNNLIVNSAVERINKGKSVLIAVSRIEHGKILLEKFSKYNDIKALFVDGSYISEEMIAALNDLNDKKIMCVIATTVFGEGVDVPSLDTLIVAKAQDSQVDTLQLAGRTLRKTDSKKEVEIIDIIDIRCKYLSQHSNSRIKTYKTEPEFNILES